MAKKEECARCPKAKRGFNENEIHCSYFGRMPVFDDTPCTYIHPEAKEEVAVNEMRQNTKKCPECGKDAPIDAPKCMYCGLTFFDWEKEAANCDLKTREEILYANKKRRYDPFTKGYIDSKVSDEEFVEMYRNYIVAKHRKSQRKNSPIMIVLFCVLVVGIGVALTSIILTNKKAERLETAQREILNEQRLAEEKRMEEERIRQEEREREEEEREREERIKQKIINELQGTWVWSGRIYVWGSQYEHVSCKIVVDGKYITFYGNSGINDQGSITDVDLEDDRIHFGSSYIDYGNVRGEYRLYYSKKDGEFFKRTSSSSNNYSHYNSSSNYSSTTFRTSSDVMAYVCNKFRNSIGNVIIIRYDGLYSNGNQITNAVRVVRFEGSRAVLSATSPYTQGTLYFRVDASRGTIIDGSGDVFYKI